MSDPNRRHKRSEADDQGEAVAYTASGHPSVEELMAAQGTQPIADPSSLHGNFWPAEESIDEFLETLHEWRGHKRTDPAA